MVAYQLKRSLRSKIVPRFADHYDRAIRATSTRLPSPASCDRLPSDLAAFVGSFYHHTDGELCDAACGRFTILGRTVEFDSIAGIDWAYRQPDEDDGLWRMKLAQLGVLHSLISSSNKAHHKTAISLLNCFMESRSFGSSDAFVTGWSPYDTSHRILAILSGLSIALQNGTIATDVRADLEAFVQLDAGFLWRNIEHEMRNNHTERNLAALCLYHFAAGSISPARAKRLDREVSRIIYSTVLADGMQIERSAMYQGLTVMSLRIFAACPFLSAATRELARKRGDAAALAWLFLTHRDGEIALFNDSWIGEVPPPATIIDSASTALPSSLPEAGYFRLTSGSVDVIMDAGEIGPRWNPAHGHPDFLALEVDVDGHRFIVDPGTSQYSPGPQRTYERSEASHNGPHYSGVELVEYYGRFKVGRLHSAKTLPTTDLSKLSVSAVGGRIRTSAGSCIRVVCALPSGGLLIVDRWTSPRFLGATNLLIPDDWSVRREGEAVRARSAESETSLVIYQGRISAVYSRTWSRRYFQTEQAIAVALAPSTDPAGAQELAFGIGIVRPSEVPGIRAEVEAHIMGARASLPFQD